MADGRPKAGGRPDEDADYELELRAVEEGEEAGARQPATGALGDEAKEVPRLVYFEPTKRFKGRLFSLKNNSSKKHAANLVGATGRSFNYEEMYDEDAYGEEAFPDARVWKVYNDEAQLFDLERIEAWRDAIDVLLVFIGLFAAVVSAFLIETSKSLQPDYAQINVIVSYAILRSLNTTVLPHAILSPDLLNPQFGEATKDNSVVSTLWYTSLTISLSTALLAMLVKQWLHQYMTLTSGTAHERARNRQFRYAGLEKYRVPLIIDLLPILLHLALGIFLVGLAIFLKPLDNVMLGLVSGVAAVPYMFYFVSIIIPLIDAQCPYKSPSSFYVYALYKSVPILLQYLRKMIWTAWQRAKQTIRHRTQQSRNAEEDGSDSEGSSDDDSGMPTNTPRYSLAKLEKDTVSHSGQQLDVDGIVYLCETSTNTNVRNIALEAFSGLPPSDADVAAVNHIIDSNLYTAVRASRATGRWDNRASSGMERRHDRLIRALCIRPDAHISAPYDLYISHPNSGLTDPRSIFGCWLSPWFQPKWETTCDFAAIFTFCSHQCFPLSIWAALIRLATRHQPQDPVVQVILVSALHLSLDMSDMGAVPLERAMQNLYVRSIGIMYLGISSTEREDVLSVALSLVTSLLSEENKPHLGKTAHDFQLLSPSDPPSTSPIPHLLSSILPPLFRSLATQYQGTFLGDEAIQMLGTILTLFFTSPHINHMSWDTLASAMRMWYAPYSQSIQAIATPTVIRRALEEFHLRDDLKEEDVKWIRKASGYLPWIFTWCIDNTMPELSEAVYSSIRELDMLPLDLESRENSTSPLHFFWSVDMCYRITIEMYTFSKAGRGERWFEDWLTYLHAPERLTFLFSKLVPYDRYSLLDLCRIWPGDLGWPRVFTNLLSLFGNRVYLDTMVDRQKNKVQEPRLHLSNFLVRMKKILGAHHVILCKPEYDIPKIGDADNPIPSSASINFTTTTPLLPESTSAVDHNIDPLGPSATPTHMLLKTLLLDDLAARDPSGGGTGLDPALESTLPVDICSPDLSSSSPLSTAPLASLPDQRAPFATASTISDACGSSEPPLEDPTQLSPSDDTQHISVNINDAGLSVSQDSLLLPRVSVDVRRQSVESMAERGDLDG